MKRRQFILAAAFAAVYTPIVYSKERYTADFQYFEFIGAFKYDISKCNTELLKFLEEESKALKATGYTQGNKCYICTETSYKQIIFIPYDLKVSSETLDTQYIVIQSDALKEYQKTALLNLDFLKAVNLASSSLLKDFPIQKLKDILLPKPGKRTEDSQLFTTKEGWVSYVLKINSTHKKHSLNIHTGSEKSSYTFKTNITEIIS